MTTSHLTQSTVPTLAVDATAARRRRSGLRRSLVALVTLTTALTTSLTTALTASGWSADAAPKMKRMKSSGPWSPRSR